MRARPLTLSASALSLTDSFGNGVKDYAIFLPFSVAMLVGGLMGTFDGHWVPLCILGGMSIITFRIVALGVFVTQDLLGECRPSSWRRPPPPARHVYARPAR